VTQFVELVLTCGSWQEAQRIADCLLEKHLVACVEFIEVQSRYHWHGKQEEVDEIKLIMQTKADNFDTIEKEVSQLHSYDTFVLRAIPMTHISQAAAEWLEKETDG
jgi:periplasmic divalent cation tolerance protein